MCRHIRCGLRAGLSALVLVGFMLISAMPAAAGCTDPPNIMAQWTVPSGASNPPDINGTSSTRGNPTTQAGNVPFPAEAFPGLYTESGIASIGDGDAGSWWIKATSSPGNYIAFEIDTRNYSQVHLSFSRKRQHHPAGPTQLDIYYNNGTHSGHIYENINDDTAWHQHSIDLTGLTNPTGETYFRIRPTGATGSDPNEEHIYFDNITFTGRTCYPPPTLSKSFDSEAILVTPPASSPTDLARLTFIIRNNQNTPNHSQNLSDISFTDHLPAGLLIYNETGYPAFNGCGGIFTADTGTRDISLSGGSLPAGSECTAWVYVFGTAAGIYNNISDPVTSFESGDNTEANGIGTATLTVRAEPSVPVVSAPDPICSGASLELSATVGVDQTAQWYTGDCKIPPTPIYTGSPFSVTPDVTTTYYVSAKDNTTGAESDCANVTVTVNGLPDAPTSPTASENPICSGGSSELSASVGEGEVVEWYTGGCGGTHVGTSSIGLPLIVSPVSTTTYYARAKNETTECVSENCAEVTVTVNTAPTGVTISPAAPSVCSGGTVTLMANATSSLDITGYQWYLGGVLIDGATGSTYETGTAGSYTVNVTNDCGTATSGAAILTVHSLPATPTNPTAAPSTINSGESATLTATVGGGETVDWYTDSCGGIHVGSGSPLSVSPTSTTTYYARARNTATDCMSASCETVTVTVLLVNRLAMNFDGIGDDVSVPDDTINHTLDLTTQGTLEAWIYPTAFTPGAGLVFKGDTEACYGFGFGTTGATSRNIRFVLSDNGDGDISLTATDNTLEANRWYHIACVWNQSAPYMYIYINGILEASGTDPLPARRANDQALRIGVSASDVYYQGVIDEVRIWNTARIQNGIQNEIRDYLCKRVVPSTIPDPDLVCYLRFDENSGPVCSDFSGNGNIGTITNAVRICSSAPIGDDSTYTYADPFSTYLDHPDGDKLDITAEGGTWSTGLKSGFHIYRVDEAPNYTAAPFGWKSFASSPRYWGVFVTGGTGPTYTMVYDYTGFPNILDETSLKMAFRNHNCDTWKNLETALDTGANTLTQNGLAGTEFILGSSMDPRNTIRYNGSSEYVSVADPGAGSALDLNDAGTLEAWIFPEAFTSDAGIVVKGTSDGINNTCYGFGLSGGATVFTGGANNNVGFVVGNTAGGVYRLTGTTSLALDTWYHVACVWNNTAVSDSMTIYINGIQDATSASAIDNAATASDEDLRIGMQAISNPDVHFQGRIDEVRVWNVARSRTDIRNTMCHILTGNETGLTGYWRFDEETTSTSSPDYSASSNNATLYNFGTATGVITARTCSEAPIGNASAWDYHDGAAPVSATLAHANGDYMFATQNGGTWSNTFSGIQIYRVDGPPVYPPDLWDDDYHSYVTPNGLTPPANASPPPNYWSSIDYYRYWGVFLTDWTTGVNEPTYDLIYHYDGNPSVPVTADGTPGNPELGLGYRPEYCYGTWTDSTAHWAFGTLQLELTGSKAQSQNGPPKIYTEYILGGISQPLAIALASFTAGVKDGCIEIYWETATEINTAGFQLWRSEGREGPFALLPGSYTSSRSMMDTQGAKYAFTDCGVVLGGKTSYYYKLEEIDMETDGNPFYGPIGPVTDLVTASQTSGDRSGNDHACFISIVTE